MEETQEAKRALAANLYGYYDREREGIYAFERKFKGGIWFAA